MCQELPLSFPVLPLSSIFPCPLPFFFLTLKCALHQDPNRPPTAWEFLNAYSFARGFMNARGLPDVMRGGRIVLKDFVKGKLLYAQPPPGYEQLESKVGQRARGDGRSGNKRKSWHTARARAAQCFLAHGPDFL